MPIITGRSPSKEVVDVAVDENGRLYTAIPSGGLEWDYVELGLTDTEAITSVIYKQGGSGGTTVLTMTLGLTNTDALTSVEKS